ncbi:MAG: hypothetical protein J0M23_07165 [Rickettsiales bacterium]|nr:hypothetical protein [Rickettsiales bacterium]
MKVSSFYEKAPRLEISGSICIIGGAITTIEQAVEIINSIRITQLTRIDFDFGLECTPEAMQLIAEHAIKPCIHLKTISISSLKNCGEEGLKYILDAVAMNPNINKVWLSFSGVSDEMQKEFNELVKGREHISPKTFKALSIIKLISSAEYVNGFHIEFLEVEDKANSLFEKCKSFPASIAEYIASDNINYIEKDALAVGQGEIGFSTQRMGTVNIRQCVVLILHDPIYKIASLVHIDRFRSLDSIIQSIKSFPKCENLDAYLVGAQFEHSGSFGIDIAEWNLQKVLKAIVGSERNIDIKGASVLDNIAPLEIVFNPQDGLLVHAKPGIYHDLYENVLNSSTEKHGLLSPIIKAFDFSDNAKTISTRNTDLKISELYEPSANFNLPLNSLDLEEDTTSVEVVGNDTE